MPPVYCTCACGWGWLSESPDPELAGVRCPECGSSEYQVRAIKRLWDPVAAAAFAARVLEEFPGSSELPAPGEAAE